MSELIPSGWLSNAPRAPSPNQDDRPDGATVDLLVIHGISLPPGRFGGPWIEDLFLNRLDRTADPYFPDIADLRVSSHLLIRRDGELVQFVPFGKRAWHAGVSSFRGRPACNDFSIGIELEGTDEVAYENAQYRKLAEVTKKLFRAFPSLDRERVAGHCDIAPGRKTDPGPAFDWSYFRSLL